MSTLGWRPAGQQGTPSTRATAAATTTGAQPEAPPGIQLMQRKYVGQGQAETNRAGPSRARTRLPAGPARAEVKVGAPGLARVRWAWRAKMQCSRSCVQCRALAPAKVRIRYWPAGLAGPAAPAPLPKPTVTPTISNSSAGAELGTVTAARAMLTHHDYWPRAQLSAERSYAGATRGSIRMGLQEGDSGRGDPEAGPDHCGIVEEIV
jgi:hypothetical protein